MATFLWLLTRHCEQVREMFAAEARERVASIQDELDSHLVNLCVVKALFESSSEVTEQEFHTFCQPLLQRDTSILAIVWMPWVRADQRKAFEAPADAAVRHPILTWQPDANGAGADRPGGDYPIDYVEPLVRKAGLLGLDLASQPACLAALVQSGRTSRPWATDPIPPWDKDDRGLRCLVFVPVHAGPEPPRTAQQRAARLRGFVGCIFTVAGAVEAGLADLAPAGIHVRLQRRLPDGRQQELYRHRSRLADANIPVPPEQPTLVGLEHRGEINLPGQEWSAHLTPAAEFFESRSAAPLWAALAGGVVLSLAGGAYMFTMARHVDRKTRLSEGLSEANRVLRGEVEARRRAEKAIQTANAELTAALDRLSQANEEMRDFVYIASHDLREPLRRISSFGSLLAESLRGNLQSDDEENLSFMIDAAGRMTQMIEGLLTYSRVNSSDVAHESVDLNAVIGDLESLELDAAVRESNAEILVPRPLPAVMGDRAQIAQLLTNLIGNGIKYARDGVRPQITVSAQDDRPDEVKILVADNGIGIPAEHYANVFRMFRRLHSRRKFPGTGIGLAVCKRIVDRHGGRIGVESVEGQGTTFWFTLSRSQEIAGVVPWEALAAPCANW